MVRHLTVTGLATTTKSSPRTGNNNGNVNHKRNNNNLTQSTWQRPRYANKQSPTSHRCTTHHNNRRVAGERIQVRTVQRHGSTRTTATVQSGRHISVRPPNSASVLRQLMSSQGWRRLGLPTLMPWSSASLQWRLGYHWHEATTPSGSATSIAFTGAYASVTPSLLGSPLSRHAHYAPSWASRSLVTLAIISRHHCHWQQP